MGRKGKRLKAQVSVRYHKEDVITKTKLQLSCDAEGEACGSSGGTSVDGASHPTADDPYPDVHMESDSEEERDTLHYQRLRRAEEAWSKVRETALFTTLQNEGSLFGTRCFFCPSAASSRCLDCGTLMSLCESCAVDKHMAIHIFHHVEILKNGIYLPLEIPRTLVWPHHQCSNGVNYRRVMVVNEKGVQNEVQVQFCACEADFLRLLRFNLWAATPSKPELAFSISLMELLHVLNLECQVAVKDFCAALQSLADETIVFANQRKLYPVIIDSFEEYRIYKHKLRNLKFSSSHGSDGLDDGTMCPACPKDQGSLLESMDALFIGRKKTAGKSIRRPLFGNILFGDDESVEQFVEQHPSSRGRNEQEACGEFLAGSAIRSRSRYEALSETAIFGRACRHEFPKRFINMKHGERLAYPVWILKDLFNGIGNSSSLQVHMLYDVACLLESHLRAQGEQHLLQNMSLAIPIFHSYGHKTQCQIKLSPRRVSGFGLTDGEVLERLWSFLRRFGRMTKEMRPNHRVDVLTDALLFYSRKRCAGLGNLLCDRMKRANVTMKEAGEELTKLLDSATVSIRREYVAEWARQEAELSSGLHGPIAPSSWTHTYIIYLKMFYDIRAKWEDASDPGKLQQLYGQMNKMEAMLRRLEQEHSVTQRWKPGDEPFRLARDEANDRQKLICLNKVHSKVVERWFLLSLKAKYADGHALAKRLSKQITKASKALKASVEEYNKTECSTTCSLPHTLEFDSVKDPDSTVWVEAADLRGSRNEIPMAIKRRAVDLYSLLDRCREEITLLQSEMKNTVEHFSRQQHLLKASLQNDAPLENCSTESTGRDLLIRRKVLSIEGHLLQLKGLFDNHIEDLSLPDLVFQGELHSVRHQQETETVGAASEGPCLLSLSESPLYSDSESDNEDDDVNDFKEDYDSPFF